MEPELSIEDILIHRCEILDQYQLETAFIDSKENLKEVILFLRESIVDISSKFSILRENLNQLHENNNSCRKLLSLCQESTEKIIAYTNSCEKLLVESNSNVVSHHNISSKAQIISEDQYQNIDVDNVSNVQELTIMDCKKELFSKPEYPEVSLLREEEYNKIPKYMIGRLTLDKVNSLVISINKVLKAKYSLLSAGREAAKKKGQLNTYLQYKRQDNIREICGCRYFFTAEDYENYIKIKLNKVTLNIMMALRHCKRIREYRSKKELYYIV